MNSSVQGQLARPSLRNIAQHGGTYQQVLDCGTHMLAVRIGGVEVLLESSGQWKSVSHLPLSSIPILYENEGGIFARFSSRLLRLAVDDAYQVHVLSEETLPAAHPAFQTHAKTIRKDDIVFSIVGPNKGLRIQQDDGTESVCILPGYSRPSSLALSRNEHEVLVADVGAIHSVHVTGSSPQVSSRLHLPGWPKDIACDDGGVYCANVLGVRWYRETYAYPYLEEIDKLSHLHFRMAKVIANQGKIVACDEVRGLHFLAAHDGRLKARGGLMLDGGAWDCEVYDGQLLVATGDAGWITAPFDWTTLTAGKPARHYGTGRTHAVVPWPCAHSYAILSSKGVAVTPMTPVHQGNTCVDVLTDISAWSATPIGDYLLVAAAKKGLYMLECEPSGSICVRSHTDTIEARDICYDGRHVWLADGKGGLRCYGFDSTQAALSFVGVFPVAGFSRGVMSRGHRVYVGAGDGGLVVLETGGDNQPCG